MGRMKEQYHWSLVNNIRINPIMHQQAPIVKRCIIALCEKMNIEHVELDIYLGDYDDLDCWGECTQGKARQRGEHNQYCIRICTQQSLRDLIATVCHEMVHVQQWETNKWRGDGEVEAENRQYILADELWNEGVL